MTREILVITKELLDSQFFIFTLMKKQITYTITTDSCWECTSHKPDSKGYPRVHDKGQQTHVYKVMYLKHNGIVPTGHIIRHTCDNRICINPAHLITGTYEDNAHDRDLRNRTAKGSANGKTILTEVQVAEIKADTKTSLRKLGKKYNISYGSIDAIRRGKTWK